MCGIEPSNLAKELPDLRIGLDSVDWYQKEVDRYNELSNQFSEHVSRSESNEKGENEQDRKAQYLELLAGFSEPFQQVGHSE